MTQISTEKERIAVQLGGDLFMLIDSDLQSRSHRNFCVTQNNNCSPGLGAGASTSEKTTRFPKRKTGGLVNLGTRWHCLQGYYMGVDKKAGIMDCSVRKSVGQTAMCIKKDRHLL